MARKHAKKFKQKRAVTRTIIQPAVLGPSRVVKETSASTPGAIAVTQTDGTTKFFLVEHEVITPAVVKTVATGPTTMRGALNTPRVKKGGK
jgi:hypothetical protein